MFKIFSLVIMTLVSSGVLAAPVILFSDLANGPNSGWSNAEPNKGVAVTIWGKGFGTAKGSNYVSVNGNNLVAEADYPDGWGQINDPVPWLQRITFHLNSNVSSGPGSISITVNGVRSNPIPFVVRSGIFILLTRMLVVRAMVVLKTLGAARHHFSLRSAREILFTLEAVYTTNGICPATPIYI